MKMADLDRSDLDFYFRSGLRAQILKYLHSRHVLILGCVLVVLECICIMAELMVDLQGIRIRFENDEMEVKKFVDFMKTQNPEAFEEFEGRTLEEILITLKETTSLWSPRASTDCLRKRSMKFDKTVREKRNTVYDVAQYLEGERKRDFDKIKFQNVSLLKNMSSVNGSLTSLFQHLYLNLHLNLLEVFRNSDKTLHLYPNAVQPHNTVNNDDRTNDDIQSEDRTADTKSFTNAHSAERKERSKRTVYPDKRSIYKPYLDVFVFTVNVDKENFHIVANFKNLSEARISTSHLEDELMKTLYYQEYERIHVVSLAIKYTGFGILTLMLAETLLKFACTGLGIFRKKFEVFDAFIVISSFILDVIFLDSRWYESGKDATTILVLLLPWRVVRIINNFLMTINHKHYIEIMTIKKAKKRGDIKLKKLQGLLVEIRRDIDLLINLSKTKGATDTEISACIYGKGRTKTLAAITSFASLMFISTLGKDPSTGQVLDDVYGDVIHDILEEDAESDKDDSHDTAEKVEFDLESSCEIESPMSSKRKSSRKISRSSPWSKGKRRATLPRRHGSRKSETDDVFYINDGYDASDEVTPKRTKGLYSKGDVRSLPVISRPSSKYVTFEVTTQVTYL